MANPIRITSLLFVVLSCSPTLPPAPQCSADPDCGESLVCDRGTCVAQPEGECRSEDTRPCGPEPVGACRQGVQHCVDGAFETTCTGAVTAAAELCNAVDDDCDGVVDEGVTHTFYRDGDGDGFGSGAPGAETRQACTAPAGFVTAATDCDDTSRAISPSAVERCDPSEIDEDCDGTVNEGCSCSTVGVAQACCANRGSQTCEMTASGSVLSACTVMPSLEFCNGVDDDCDGNTDELYSLTSADGGSITTSDGGVIGLDGGCSVGVGACARTSGTACISGSLACLAIAGTPGTELCNELDDDCDGQTDEATDMVCPASGQSCNAGSCACPSGQSVCGSSCQIVTGVCTAGTGACVRQGSLSCLAGSVSCSAVAGTPATETCDGIDNDCDGTVDEGVVIACVLDADNDLYADPNSPVSQHCPASGRSAFGNCPLGHVGSGAVVGVDCAPSNAALYRNAALRQDGDNDTYCAGPSSSTCIGATAPAGRRIALACAATDDCNDASASQFVTRQVRTDADGDQFCIGGVTSQCAGNAPLAGTRAATSCLGEDCRDANAFATTICSVPMGFTTVSHSMSCGIGLPGSVDRFVPTNTFCPTSFSVLNLRTEQSAGAGWCSVIAMNTLRQACTGFNGSTCRIVGDCTAN